MDTKIVAPDRTIEAVENNRMSNRFATWTEQATGRLNNIVLSGSGTPEGSVNAPRLTFYLDEDTDTLYIKKTQTGSVTGWVAL